MKYFWRRQWHQRSWAGRTRTACSRAKVGSFH